jgi:farnesyl-diphosphate farnesyltransferase
VTPTLNELLHAASRTFAVGIDLLPHPLRKEVEIAYLLLRVSDYLEDSAILEVERKVALLEAWADVLAGALTLADFERALGRVTEDSPDALVARNVARVHGALSTTERTASRELIQRHVRDSTLGMARWVKRGPDIANEHDLDDYMHEVAGRVGWLLTDLFAQDVPEVQHTRAGMRELGREFGLGLQTVNVIRGLHVDWRRGWVYVPRTFLGEADLDPSTMFEDDGEAAAGKDRALNRLVAKAERHLAAAGRYIERLPRRRHGIRLFCELPYFFALRTLALSRGNPYVFRGEVKIDRKDVERITGATRILGWSNNWLRWYATRLSRITNSAERWELERRGSLELAPD